jgi:hypothetical protein
MYYLLDHLVLSLLGCQNAAKPKFGTIAMGNLPMHDTGMIEWVKNAPIQQ